MTDPVAERMLVTDASRAISTHVLSLPVGSLFDPPGREGLAYLTGQMLLRGAGSMSQAQIADELDYLGGSLSVGTGRERTSLSGDSLTRNLDAFEGLLATILNEPTFVPSELAKLKRQTLAELAQVRDNDAALGQRFFVRELFRGHPYGRPLKGTDASIAAITTDDLRAFYETRYARGGALLGSAGDIDKARQRVFAARTVDRLDVPRAASATVPLTTTAAGYRTVIIDKPERSQTQVFLGHVTISTQDPAYFPLLVAHTIFGGTFTARLSHEIREKRGWSYGAYSYLSGDRHLGTFTQRFYPSMKDTVPALELADQLFHDLVRDGVSADEVEAAKSYLSHSHAFSIDTPERHLSELVGARLTGRPSDYVATFTERIAEVELDAVNAAIRAHLTPDNVVCAIVATEADLRAPLAAWGRPTHIDVVDYRQNLTL